MNLEHKTITSGGVQQTSEDGVVEALVSVTGIKDNVNDVIHPGAYEKTLAKRTPKGVWSHDWNSPVSKVEEIKELLPGDEKLPKTLSDGTEWPTHAGALYVKARFNLNTQAGRDAYENVKFFGDTCEWSIGYKVGKGGSERGKDGTRYIKSLDLFEFSPVLFGAASEARSLVTSIKGMFGSDEEWKKAVSEAIDSEEKTEEEPEDADVESFEAEGGAVAPEAEESAPESEDSVSEDQPEGEEISDEDLIALLEEDGEEVDSTVTEVEVEEGEKSEERNTEVKVNLSPVLLEQLQQAQTLIKSILDNALQVEDTEAKSDLAEIESKSIEDALHDVMAGSVEERIADEIGAAIEKFNTAIIARDEDGIKSHSIAALDLIDANLTDSSAEQERELKTLAKSIGEAVAAFDSEPVVEEEKSEEVEEVEVKTVSMTKEELDALLAI